MADVVQFKLERMLDELDDLDRRGLFSRQEIAKIVKDRRKFEFRLKRPSPLKQDFLAYIDYEKQVDALRRLRKKSFSRKSAGGKKKSKKSVSDFTGVARIVEIYRQATNRFKGDIELWFQYLEFCKAQRHGMMKTALANLVRFHPRVPGAWIYAAAWEFDSNLNVAAARALMQDGLRACPDSEDLWVEYLRMELTYLNKLKTRKVLLGDDKGTLTRDHMSDDEKQWRDENKELFMDINGGEDNCKISSVQDGESEDKVDILLEQGLSILQTVYNGAIEAIPSSFCLRTRFLEILDAVNLPHSEDMRKNIHDDMKRDFSKEPMYWDWLARGETPEVKEMNPEQFRKAIQVYEEGLKFVPSEVLFKLYVKFLRGAIGNENTDEETTISLHSHVHGVDLSSHLLRVFEEAESVNCFSEDLAGQHVSFLLQLGKLEEAKMLLEKFCSGKFINSAHLWKFRLTIEMRLVEAKSPSPSKTDLAHIFKLLSNILMKINISESEDLWLLGLKYFANQRRHFDKLTENSLTVLARDGGSDSSFSLSSTIVDYILQRDGLEKARETYKRFLALPHPGLSFYKSCIELESNLASTGDKNALPNARKLYESALSTYDQDTSLWRDYYSMEVKMGTSESAAAVHWRATKVLKNNFALISSSNS